MGWSTHSTGPTVAASTFKVDSSRSVLATYTVSIVCTVMKSITFQKKWFMAKVRWVT